MSDKKFATLGALNRKSRSRSGSADSDDGHKRQQGFYVGGSEHSGQQVLGPSSSEDLISRVFNAAREHGAETVRPEENAAHQGARDTVKFASAGYRLGDAHHPTENVPAPDSNTEQPEQQEVTLTMWEDGFSVDDGPLRQFNAPENHAFLQSVMQGRIPMELVRQYPGRTIDLRMERKSEAYKARPHKAKPFSGQGHRLGDIVPPIVGAGVVGHKAHTDETGPSSDTSTAATNAVPSDIAEEAQKAITLRDGEPVTQLQIRLPSGQRVIGRFNHSHRVEEVRSFIIAANPELAFQPFSLMTAFPSKVIEAEQETLKEAGLLNSVVVVRPIKQ